MSSLCVCLSVLDEVPSRLVCLDPPPLSPTAAPRQYVSQSFSHSLCVCLAFSVGFSFLSIVELSDFLSRPLMEEQSCARAGNVGFAGIPVSIMCAGPRAAVTQA